MKNPELGAHAWQEAFLAVAVLLGEPVDAAVAAAGLAGAAGSSRPDLVQRLRSPSRDVRARALADGLTPVVLVLTEMHLA